MMQRNIQCFVLALVIVPWPCCWAQSLNLVNGDFELDTPVVAPPSGWTVGRGEVYVTSGADLGPTDPTSALSGNNFVTMNRMAAGKPTQNEAQPMSIFQTVDVSAFSDAIDEGDRFVSLSFAYNAADPSDNGIVSIDFFDANGAPLGIGATLQTSWQPTPRNCWAARSLIGHVPVGARAIRFSLAGVRVEGGIGFARNVSFDNLSASMIDAPQIAPRDVVNGNLIQLAENGAWNWFQDERAIVDEQNGELVVGYVSNREGAGGEAVDGHVMTTHFDLTTGARRRYIHNDIESYGAGDDHIAPALLKKSDGDVLIFYAGHNNRNGVEDDRSYFRTFDSRSRNWGSESEYHWWDVIPSNAPGASGTTFSNVFQLSSEDRNGDGNGRLYNIARTQQSPHIMYSDNNGITWKYGGQLTQQNSTPPASSYIKGYYKYSSNGVDRIDFIATEYHPRDCNTSIYHAYIRGGKMYDSAHNEIDSDIFDAAHSFNAENVTSTDDFTKVFQAGSNSNSRAWVTDVQSFESGTVVALWKARAGAFGNHLSGADDHRIWYGKCDPINGKWSTTEIAKAGGSLYDGEETDYTGLGAIHPNDPNILYISTEIDPNTGAVLPHHEIYRGESADEGASWSWTAITENSSFDNLRPIIPAWEENSTAVLWWRGSMSRSQHYDTAVVGIIDRKTERSGLVEYVDACASNTTLADGSELTFSGPSSGAGIDDDCWHQMTGVGNKGTVFTADAPDSEDVPTIRTVVSDLDAGTYDVFVFFWSDVSQDWRIEAGLSEEDLMLFRVRGSQQASEDEFAEPPILDEGMRTLYRAYLGRVEVSQGESICAFINDSTGRGTERVWYDGIGYAPVTDDSAVEASAGE